MENQRRLLGGGIKEKEEGGKEEEEKSGQLTILLHELSINHAGSRDQLISIKVDEVVAGLG